MQRTVPFDAKTVPIAVRGENCTTRGKKTKQNKNPRRKNRIHCQQLFE